LTANAPADLELMRAALLLESDPAAAARRAGAVLAASPGHAEASLLLGTALGRLGDAAAAVTVFESLAQARPDSAFIQFELGRAYGAAGRSAPAVAALRRAVELDAQLADGWRELAQQLFAQGETLAGDQAYARYSRLWLEPPELGDASRALAENRLDAAEAILRRRLQQLPRDVVAQRMLADLATRREDYAEAEQILNQCLALEPGYAPARYDLANALSEQQRITEMLPLVERLLALEPDNFDCLSLKARGLRLIGRGAEALALMERATSANPQQHEAWLLFGHLLRELGQQPRAIEMFRRALAVRPGSGRAYSALANLKTFRFEPDDLDAMRSQLGATVQREDATEIEFALGKALEDAGEFADSFTHYARGNALHRTTFFYDADAISAEMQLQMRLFTREFFAAREDWGSARRDPIFIVGVPRSGSTLLEQILASHSEVEGTHELLEIGRLAFQLWSRTAGAERAPYPQPVAALRREEVEELAERYLSRTQLYRPLGRARFVDKMLGNFSHLGLIHLMFPRAAIIDARRHPLACGFSCFRQLFSRGQKFTYELREFGRYYRDYVTLMEHFDAVLPGRVHRVYYEQLIADPRGELQKILDYCGLPFEERCLRFHENPRTVHTLSSEQVRQPLYSDSIDQWRNFEPWLGPLKQALGDLIEHYPAGRGQIESA
jgi:tetratricopeptide (TPR) repeat protein